MTDPIRDEIEFGEVLERVNVGLDELEAAAAEHGRQVEDVDTHPAHPNAVYIKAARKRRRLEHDLRRWSLGGNERTR